MDTGKEREVILNLRAETYERLQTLSKKSGKTLTEYIWLVLTKYVQNMKKEEGE